MKRVYRLFTRFFCSLQLQRKTPGNDKCTNNTRPTAIILLVILMSRHEITLFQNGRTAMKKSYKDNDGMLALGDCRQPKKCEMIASGKNRTNHATQPPGWTLKSGLTRK